MIKPFVKSQKFQSRCLINFLSSWISKKTHREPPDLTRENSKQWKTVNCTWSVIQMGETARREKENDAVRVESLDAFSCSRRVYETFYFNLLTFSEHITKASRHWRVLIGARVSVRLIKRLILRSVNIERGRNALNFRVDLNFLFSLNSMTFFCCCPSRWIIFLFYSWMDEQLLLKGRNECCFKLKRTELGWQWNFPAQVHRWFQQKNIPDHWSANLAGKKNQTCTRKVKHIRVVVKCMNCIF